MCIQPLIWRSSILSQKLSTLCSKNETVSLWNYKWVPMGLSYLFLSASLSGKDLRGTGWARHCCKFTFPSNSCTASTMSLRRWFILRLFFALQVLESPHSEEVIYIHFLLNFYLFIYFFTSWCLWSMCPAGPKIALCFPHLFIRLSVCLCIHTCHVCTCIVAMCYATWLGQLDSYAIWVLV